MLTTALKYKSKLRVNESLTELLCGILWFNKIRPIKDITPVTNQLENPHQCGESCQIHILLSVSPSFSVGHVTFSLTLTSWHISSEDRLVPLPVTVVGQWRKSSCLNMQRTIHAIATILKNISTFSFFLKPCDFLFCFIDGSPMDGNCKLQRLLFSSTSPNHHHGNASIELLT